MRLNLIVVYLSNLSNITRRQAQVLFISKCQNNRFFGLIVPNMGNGQNVRLSECSVVWSMYEIRQIWRVWSTTLNKETFRVIWEYFFASNRSHSMGPFFHDFYFVLYVLSSSNDSVALSVHLSITVLHVVLPFLWPRTTFISKLFLIIVASINVPYCSRCIAFFSTLIQFIRFIVFCSFFNVFMKQTFPFIVLISLQFRSWQGKINACNETWCITESSGCYQKWFDIYLISNAKASSVEQWAQVETDSIESAAAPTIIAIRTSYRIVSKNRIRRW